MDYGRLSMADPAPKLNFSDDEVQLVPGSGKRLKATNLAWDLIRGLLARERIHWLDGFVLLETWRAPEAYEGQYLRAIRSLRAKANAALSEVGLPDSSVAMSRGPDARAELRHSARCRPLSDLADSVQRARSARDAFCGGEDGWLHILKAIESGDFDASSLAAAICYAPTAPPTPLADAWLRLAQALALQEEHLLQAMVKLTRVPRLQLAGPRGVPSLREVVRRWAHELVAIRRAVELLNAEAETSPQDCPPDLSDFIDLASRLQRNMPSWTPAGPLLGCVEPGALIAAAAEELDLKERLCECQLTVRVIDHERDYLTVDSSHRFIQQ